jgi:hypothetical protein
LIIMVRSLPEVAREIRDTWTNVNYAAAPYLDALLTMSSAGQNYGADDGKSIVLYFLSNASSFRGADARRLKAELKALAGVK